MADYILQKGNLIGVFGLREAIHNNLLTFNTSFQVILHPLSPSNDVPVAPFLTRCVVVGLCRFHGRTGYRCSFQADDYVQHGECDGK